MNPSLSPIIQAEALLSIYSKENLVIVDIRNGKQAKEDYLKKHLAGALYVDLNTQLSDIKEEVSDGGRHPLPSLVQFSETLGALGITENSHVIIYDDKNGANAAARLWWMLRAIGHEAVRVLDGGFQEAERKNLPMSSSEEIAKKKTKYEISEWMLPLADIEEIEKVSKDQNCLIIDVREADRYNGLTEPIDLIAGHIPGAINVPFTSNLNENGLFKSPSELKAKYQAIIEDRTSDKVFFHCGSGVTACHSILAMVYAGIDFPKLYVGSWSEWSRNNKPMETIND
jgi:thiosulfate/3-mercaptopyruvate sulfurtransferase